MHSRFQKTRPVLIRVSGISQKLDFVQSHLTTAVDTYPEWKNAKNVFCWKTKKCQPFCNWQFSPSKIHIILNENHHIHKIPY